MRRLVDESGMCCMMLCPVVLPTLQGNGKKPLERYIFDVAKLGGIRDDEKKHKTTACDTLYSAKVFLRCLSTQCLRLALRKLELESL